MKQLFFVILLALSISSCKSQENSNLEAINKELTTIEGKYIFEKDIFEIPVVKERLYELLGNKVYNDAVECFMTVDPYKITRKFFHFWGQSDLSYNNCNIVFDMQNNVFHIKLYYDETDEEKVFSENMELYEVLPKEVME